MVDYTTDFHPFFAISANSANPAGICGNRGDFAAISAPINVAEYATHTIVIRRVSYQAM